MLQLESKRLKALDAMRGIAILFMIPFHIFLFGGGVPWSGGSGSNLLFVDLSRPLGSGLILFYFVTGMTLIVSFASKRENQSFYGMFRHMLRRYGGYLILGVIIEIVFRHLVWGQKVTDLIVGIFGGWTLTISSPIMGLSLAAILAFPFILYLSWKQLLAAAIVLASTLTTILYRIPIPDFFLLNLLFTNNFAVLKGVPIVMFGAAIGYLLLEGRDLKKTFLLIGGTIASIYTIIPLLLGRGMLHLLFAIWAYPYAVTFITGISLAFLGLFQYLDVRKINLSPATVLGRSSFFVYYGHFILLFVFLALIGFSNVTMTILLSDMLVSTIGIWVIVYFYSKRRWGPPSNW